jgi:hypothetical protein
VLQLRMVYGKLTAFAGVHGGWIEPAERLRELAKAGWRFADPDHQVRRAFSGGLPALGFEVTAIRAPGPRPSGLTWRDGPSLPVAGLAGDGSSRSGYGSNAVGGTVRNPGIARQEANIR